jgi:hypothetical protein
MPDSFELPDLAGMDLAALRAVEAQAASAFTSRYDVGASTPEDLEALQSLAESVQAVRAAVADAEAAEAAEAEAPAPEAAPEAPAAGVAALDSFLEALAQRPVEQAAPAPVSEPAPAPAAEAPAPVVPLPAAPIAPAPPVSIAASAELPAEVQLPVESSPLVILASADIPGFGTASEIAGWDGLVAAVGAKARAVPNMQGSKYPVASIMLPLKPERRLDGLSDAEIRERMNDLSSPAYLDAELSRTASGGWCAPNETIYEFACLVEAPPEMVDLPTFGAARRGGVNFPISPTYRDFKSLENNGLFTWTEADDIAAATGSPTKPCFKVPCVDFDSARLELEGLCVTAGNLTEMAYPELIQRYLSLVMTAHLHRMNTQRIAKMLAARDESVTIPATFAAASAVFDALLLQVADLRDQFSMASGSTVEVMMPRWVRGPARSDVARRELASLESISDADVTSYWQAAGVRIQFVSDWQELGDPDSPATAWPDTFQFLMWLPGSYKLLSGEKLDIAVARDSTQNATNDYTVAFTEEAYQVFKPGCGSRLVTIPICPSGASGERVELSC